MCYHTKCYKDFTAVPKQPSTNSENQGLKQRLLRVNVEHPTTSSSGVYEPKCIFCNKVTKSSGKDKREYLGSLEVESSEVKIKVAAVKLQDNVLLAKISGQDLISKEVKFHHSCRKTHLNKAQRTETNKEKTPQVSHQVVFAIVKSYVKQTLVDIQGSEKLLSLHKRYIDALGIKDTSYKSQNLCDKLLKEFAGVLKTCKSSNKDGLIIHNHHLTAEAAIRRANFDDNGIKEAAFYLRSFILSSKVETLAEPLTINSLKYGQGETPLALLQFFQVLYTGESAQPENKRVQRLVQSVSDDVIFATTRGRIKPGKHLCLGLGLKSLTGSRRVLEILNRFGHSVSYHTVETIETQMATEISDRNQAIPDGLTKSAGLSTSLAWDNYDENTETLSGSGTLHDTVEICYQNIPNTMEQGQHQDEMVDVPLNTKPTNQPSSSVSKRKFKFKEANIQPYRKKPKMSVFKYQVKKSQIPPYMSTIEYRDLFWMMNIALCDSTPMWAGWNSLVTEDPLPRHTIGYMENLNLPPTRLDVVAETLKQSQQVAKECGDEYVVVHYDLAVAKPAMQIQSAESPVCDNVFICFGPFHILLAYFGGLGYILDGSGGPELLTETGVLAAGSLNGFLKGKHYNRYVKKI